MPTEPLTPAQVELIEQYLEERQVRVQTAVDRAIAEAVSPLQVELDTLRQQVATLQEAVGVLDGAAMKVGSSIALRMAGGLLLCASDGGPTNEGDPVELEARKSVGAWESYAVERGA